MTFKQLKILWRWRDKHALSKYLSALRMGKARQEDADKFFLTARTKKGLEKSGIEYDRGLIMCLFLSYRFEDFLTKVRTFYGNIEHT